MWACGSRLVVATGDSVTPAACGSTRATCGAPSNMTGTRASVACWAKGTAGLKPSMRTRPPAVVPITVGFITSLAPCSARAMATTVSAVAIPGRCAACWAGLPKSANASAATPLSHNGTGAT